MPFSSLKNQVVNAPLKLSEIVLPLFCRIGVPEESEGKVGHYR